MFFAFTTSTGKTKNRSEWLSFLAQNQKEREAEIDATAAAVPEGNFGVHPIRLCRAIDAALDDDSILVTDGWFF